MTSFTCHDCGQAIPEGGEVWLGPADGRPDDDQGEPYCRACAGPVGLAA
jgi:hypothetical protein